MIPQFYIPEVRYGKYIVSRDSIDIVFEKKTRNTSYR